MLQFCKKVKLYTKLAPETVRSLFFISKFISDHLHITIIYKSIFFNWSITCKLNYWITCKISSRGNFIWKCPSYVWFVWLVLFLFFSFFFVDFNFFLVVYQQQRLFSFKCFNANCYNSFALSLTWNTASCIKIVK